MMENSFNWSPCRFIEYDEELGDPRFGLTFDKFENTLAFLEAKGFEGDGYTWHGIVEALVRLKASTYSQYLSYDPKASMFCARSSKIDALKVIHHWICQAIEDENILQEAIDAADLNLIE